MVDKVNLKANNTKLDKGDNFINFIVIIIKRANIYIENKAQ